MKAILSVLITVLILIVVTMPAVGQTKDTSTSVAKSITKKGPERYAPVLTPQQMAEIKEYLGQFSDSTKLSDLTVGDLRIVMGYVYSAAIKDGHRFEYVSMGLKNGVLARMKFEIGEEMTELYGRVNTVEDNASAVRYEVISVSKELTGRVGSHERRLHNLEVVATGDKTPVTVQKTVTVTMTAFEAAMEEIRVELGLPPTPKK